MARITEWILMLAIALALPVVLLACGSGPPSASPIVERTEATPTTERTATTPKPTAAAPDRGSAVGSDTTTATPEPTAMETPESRTAPDQGSAETDRESLVALYNATDGPNWANNDNWFSDKPLSEWYGVITDASGRVTELNLDSNQLSGEIPAELGQLTNLDILALALNELSGEIPAELGQLSNLDRLTLIGNDLSGCVPDALRDVERNDLAYLGLPLC